MKKETFEKIIIIEWYDNIIKSFLRVNDKIYYCSLVFQDLAKEEYIYVSISLEYFKQKDEILKIIENDTIDKNWEKLYSLLNSIYEQNESILIKTQNLQLGVYEIVVYEKKFNWDNKILFSDYPECLDKASEVDNWNKYFVE